eukprot:CAMPEP_0117438794 /NCGR_PEP_ID=MMETSP0759-20121206/2238_1 /TAXON_ID=63605 /ORGANISM="Percolomonas cosmopolitus, Strain WS" /LENGTH=439 /DNA_ID=CAMNT_0005230499 /DNA_START=1 /DNA_END=1320 /DNA_ORIENTATION=+
MASLTSSTLHTTNQIHPTVQQVSQLSIAQLQSLISTITTQNKFLKEEITISEEYAGDNFDLVSTSNNTTTGGGFNSSQRNSLMAGGANNNSTSNSVGGGSSAGNDSAPDSGADDSDAHSDATGGGSVASSSPRNSNAADADGLSKKKKKKKMRMKRTTRTLAPLSLERKLEVVQRQIEDLSTQLETEKKEFKKKIDNFSAAMEEADIEIDAADKEHKEFVRVIIKGGVNPRTQKVLAEKLVNFLDNELRQRDQLIDKYRLKNTAIKAQIKKLKQHLEHREEMGEILSKIDYDQLEIENEQMRRKISERNTELVQLTLQTGKTIQTLNALMDKLNRLTQNANSLKRQIDVRENAVEQIKKEIVSVKKEKIQQEKKHKNLRQHLEEVRVPSILDYVKIKAELDVIRKEVSNWERKVEISETNRKLHRTKLQKLERDVTQRQ